MLIDAGVLEGRTLTSWPSLQTDIRNAGGNWVDEDLQMDAGQVTSRKPDDVDTFCDKIVEDSRWAFTTSSAGRLSAGPEVWSTATERRSSASIKAPSETLEAAGLRE